jgi:hypothetical protein
MHCPSAVQIPGGFSSRPPGGEFPERASSFKHGRHLFLTLGFRLSEVPVLAFCARGLRALSQCNGGQWCGFMMEGSPFRVAIDLALRRAQHTG